MNFFQEMVIVTEKLLNLSGQLQETLPGLTINVKTVPLNNAIELMRKGDYELSVGMWGPDYQDPMTFLESSVSGNRMNYSSPTFDQLIEEATTKYANDPETRWQTLIKAEKYWWKKMPL